MTSVLQHIPQDTAQRRTHVVPKEWVDTMNSFTLDQELESSKTTLPKESKLTFDEHMDFRVIERAAEYCRFEILTKLKEDFQKYFDLIPDSEVPIHQKLISDERLIVFKETYIFSTWIGGYIGLQELPVMETYKMYIFFLRDYWYRESLQEGLKALTSPDAFGTDNYEVDEHNPKYTIGAAFLILMIPVYHGFPWMYRSNRKLREEAHRYYCGAIRKYLEVVDGVEVVRSGMSEPSNYAIIRTYLRVHDGKKRE